MFLTTIRHRLALAILGAVMAACSLPGSAIAGTCVSPDPGVECVMKDGYTFYRLVDPATKIMQTIPGAQDMWRQCYDDCRKHQECNPSLCSSHCIGEVMAVTKNTQDIADMMKYNVMAAMGAQCIEKMSDYIKAIRDAIKNIGTGDPLEVIANAMIDAIADQIMSQILNALTNEICSVTNQVLNYVDSVIKNAICLPAGTIGNPFNFNLNLKDMQCNGMSINLLTGDTSGNLITNVNMPPVSLYNTGINTGVSNTGSTAPTYDNVTLPSTTGGTNQ